METVAAVTFVLQDTGGRSTTCTSAEQGRVRRGEDDARPEAKDRSPCSGFPDRTNAAGTEHRATNLHCR